MRTLCRLCLALLACLAIQSAVSQPDKLIQPGKPWMAGNASLQAHGGGIIQVGKTWYWIGENKTHGSSFYANSCYSSTDLVHWTFVNDTLKLQASGDLGPNRVVERPKIIYNARTKTYVMYMHIDDPKYAEAKVGVATSPTVCGDYTYRGSFRPLGFQSRDIGVFQDSDGSAYLLTEDRVNGLRIDALSSDYLSVTKAVAVLPDMEAPAMIKVQGKYFLFSSHLTGWNTNDNQYATAPSPAGPWSALSNFAPAGSHTFNSQTTFVLPVQGKGGITYIYMGDRWMPKDLASSTYIWLPLTISGTSVSMTWRDRWSLNAAAGTWTPAQ
ncbi:family 43 glycosylhydrolase [Occallatibacter riparius]|uniref:Family 43 glycosylhydrolase n=1 Tax=Occallatibacter riparius TaxID=1002689 RepID=A0A9J7BU40_9BACT|nr:family 43 glycosylhydrolase [Occallatibacter riparius]UWZ86403.1 family 43 glycosylhydrolase [Occallatibacter riparius]